jgi:hypothetical protein
MMGAGRRATAGPTQCAIGDPAAEIRVDPLLAHSLRSWAPQLGDAAEGSLLAPARALMHRGRPDTVRLVRLQETPKKLQRIGGLSVDIPVDGLLVTGNYVH